MTGITIYRHHSERYGKVTMTAKGHTSMKVNVAMRVCWFARQTRIALYTTQSGFHCDLPAFSKAAMQHPFIRGYSGVLCRFLLVYILRIYRIA